MLLGLGLPVLIVLMMIGIFVDWCLGEVTRWHPLIGFGSLANAIEMRLNRDGKPSYLFGALAWMLAVVPLLIISYWFVSYSVQWTAMLGYGVHVAMLYFCIGLHSLQDHILPIERALRRGDIRSARHLTSRIVSRDTSHATEEELAKAAVESMLENGNDAVFGTLFWFLIAGGPGAVLFRMVNTLDAMWGYRTPHFEKFGCVAARIDDVMNWIPARLTALSYMALGNTKKAWHCWRTQAPAWSSPNAGPVMAAGAGALGVILGGEASYHGVIEYRPPLGIGRHVEANDIVRAWRLVALSVAVWIAAIGTVALMTLLKV
jgi:adenosylcobinamide-phosphate synthase